MPDIDTAHLYSPGLGLYNFGCLASMLYEYVIVGYIAV